MDVVVSNVHHLPCVQYYNKFPSCSQVNKQKLKKEKEQEKMMEKKLKGQNLVKAMKMD